MSMSCSKRLVELNVSAMVPQYRRPFTSYVAFLRDP